MSKEETLKGHYELVYSPDDGGWYAELWWNQKQSPVYKSKAMARNWAIESGGEHDHSKGGQ